LCGTWGTADNGARADHGKEPMATYILVHGAWHGGWCWHRIVARLERAGHRVLAPDLLSLGRDRTPVGSVTLADWTEQITALIDAQPEPVVLVGHSRGGIVLSEVAERRPTRIRVLVYVTAFLLENGCSLQMATREHSESLVGPNLVVADDHRSVRIRDEAVRETFYGECTDDDVALARALLVAEPMAPLATPVRTSDANFGTVPRMYVECARDRAMTLASQRQMQAALPCRDTVLIDTDHSPFLSRPDELASVLLRATG
jgi:pimeloyl-ACP methyl ester carboxylesterase